MTGALGPKRRRGGASLVEVVNLGLSKLRFRRRRKARMEDLVEKESLVRLVVDVVVVVEIVEKVMVYGCFGDGGDRVLK